MHAARHFLDEILVLHRGRVGERGPADAAILDPHHDYTRLLARATPDPERVGKVVVSEFGFERSQIDDSRCYDDAAGERTVHPGARETA